MVRTVVHVAMSVGRAKLVSVANVCRTAVRAILRIFVLSMDRIHAGIPIARIHHTVALVIMRVQIIRPRMRVRIRAKMVYASTHVIAVIPIVVV